ncbi:hypothetical protein [Methanoplanus endosymbiosus]|uniref:Uncharacterized protein n=1 Tax=Methanoplanus endosymbiosus TaxID=33865 RepID=A0A9E7PKT4_9EURY|nr:hypothetical protein [Methanoplanus endosymbiosus]UUX91985.1 hypothetical protein L6E24_11545 [Methanoplanus endosymbiosus]
MKNNSIIILIILISEVIILAGSAGMPIISGIANPENMDSNMPIIPGENHPGEEMNKKGDGMYIYLKTFVSALNLGLTFPLFMIYAGIYRKVKSSFTLGLMAVIFALGMYAITSNPAIITLFGGFPGYIGIFQIVPDLCATAALIILIRISLE